MYLILYSINKINQLFHGFHSASLIFRKESSKLTMLYLVWKVATLVQSFLTQVQFYKLQIRYYIPFKCIMYCSIQQALNPINFDGIQKLNTFSSYNNFQSLMLQSIISSRVEKSKICIQSYLSNGSQVQLRQQQQSKSIVRPQQPSIPSKQSNESSTQPKSKVMRSEVQIKMIKLNGKQYSKDGISLRFSKEQGKLEIFYDQDDSSKIKMEIKREIISGGKKVKINYSDGTCTFDIKTIQLFKEDLQQTAIKGLPIWVPQKKINDQTLIILLKDKEKLKSLMQNPFMEGLFETSLAVSQNEVSKEKQTQQMIQGGQGNEDDGKFKLIPPTLQQSGQVQKIVKTINSMKQQDKVAVLTQVFKIKKQFSYSNSIKKLKCPVNFCIYCQKKSYKDAQQLKNHLKVKHPQLSKHGIELSESDGTFEYGSKAMDLALFIGKMYPQQMKKLIKQMKTKPADP